PPPLDGMGRATPIASASGPIAVTPDAEQALQQRSRGKSGPFQTGHLISAYRVEELVGQGGMGWVYRARHEMTARPVALKILREDQLAQDRSIDRMMREASILATVAHDGLPRFYECGMLDDGRPWIAMELVEGVPLTQRM